jgi:hypothetical protein
MSDAPNTPDAPEEELPPFVIEGARSGRSRCKVCRRTINKETLRLGILIEGPYGTGYLWHHLNCAARRKFEQVEQAYEDQAWNNAKTPPEKVPAIDELRKLREEAESRRQNRKQIPYAELAPTGRAKCKHCGEPLEKGSVRVTLGRGVYFGSQVRTGPINVHPRCVAAELKADDCTTEVEGFEGALRANTTDLDADQLNSLVAEIGELDG